VSGCAVGSASVGQDTVAETLARFRALQDVSSATVSTYAAGDCHGVAFSMTISYGDAFAIPSARLTASPRTTVGG
jgi:hypothetical protein